MDKMKLAHDFAMKLIAVGATNKTEDIIRLGWEYADAMQKEADSRKPKGLPQALSPEVTHLNNTLAAQKMVHGSDEWHPDWSQAPEKTTHWGVELGTAYWLKEEVDGLFCKISKAPPFGYQGAWQDSLRKRP